MKRARRQVRIFKNEWQAYGKRVDLPDGVVDEYYRRFIALARELPIAPSNFKEWHRRVAEYVLNRILISGYDIGPVLADPDFSGPFKTIRRSGRRTEFSEEEVINARRLIANRPSGHTKAMAVAEIVNRHVTRKGNRTALTASLLNAVDWRRRRGSR